MTDLIIKQVDAFTTQPFSGNPAGVITDADGLSSSEMLRIAGEMNLAETAFVTMPESADSMFRIRFFTPTEEVDISGHVTIACCYALIEEGRIPLTAGVTPVIIETNAGNISVDIHVSSQDADDPGVESMEITMENGKSGYLRKIMMHQEITNYSESSIGVEEIAQILGIESSEITSTGLPVEIISAGLSQLVIPIKQKETILNLNPDLIKLSLLNKKHGIETNHIFTLDTYSENCISYARHFAPAVGMWEDPATGTAAAGLGTYLFRHGIATSGMMVMEQGKEKEALAKILVEISGSGGDYQNVQIGGLAITSISRKVQISDGTLSVV